MTKIMIGGRSVFNSDFWQVSLDLLLYSRDGLPTFFEEMVDYVAGMNA